MTAVLSRELVEVLEVDQEKCVNCHACISACPVKFCNDGSGDYVKVNKNMCIACGSCLTACTHEARKYIDNFQAFLQNVQNKKPIICLLTPSAAANFPEKYLHLNGWLKSLGVDALFDVSFGAELTIKSYLQHLQTNAPKTIISQPCPAIVTYIELYKPELIQHLAPVDSPILHTIKMIKEFYTQYKDHQIAIISPCSAKMREFAETGYGDYNVGFKSIDKYLSENQIDLNHFEKVDFDNPPAERAVMFSTPGGLLQTVERTHPEMRFKSRKIEGVNTIYPYLDKLNDVIDTGKAPKLIDCLNCENGCNAGPLTLVHEKSPDEIEYWVLKRNLEMQDFYQHEKRSKDSTSVENIEEALNKYWKPDLYTRAYVNLWTNVSLKYPNEIELKDIYATMHKYSEKEVYNCSSCGYGTCERMATAIFNGLNKPENCHFYLSSQNEISTKEITQQKHHLSQILDTSLEGFFEINLNGIIISANPAVRNILKKNDIIGRSIYEFVDEENLQVIQNQMKLREENKQSSYELVFTQSDGKKVECILSGSPLYSQDNVRIGSFAMVTDISQLKKSQAELRLMNEELETRVELRTAQLNETNEELNSLVEELQTQHEEILAQTEALEESQQRIIDLVEFLPDPVLVIDKNQRVAVWNKAMVALTGVQQEEIIGKGNYEYSLPFFGERRPFLIDLIKNTDENLSADFENIIRKANSISAGMYASILKNDLYLLGSASILFTANEQYDGAVVVLKDMTSHKKAEVIIQKANAELENQRIEIENKSVELSEKLEELMINNMIIQDINKELDKLSIVARETDNSIAIIDPEGNYEWVNESYTKLYGDTLEDMYARNSRNIVDVSENPNIMEIFSNCVENKCSVTYESNAKSESGLKKWIQTTLTPLFDEDGKIKKLIAVETDISTLKEAQFDITQKKEEIEAQRDEMELQKDEMETQRDQIALKNKQIGDSILYAKRIQSALIPTEEVFSKLFSENFILYKPRDIVSGDFYWCKQIENFIYIVAADCTGHGVPGAFMSMLAISQLNEIIKERIIVQPHVVLNKLRERIKKSLHQSGQKGQTQDGMDISICLIDTLKKTLDFAGAYNPMYIVRKNVETSDFDLLVTKADRMPIGVHPKENQSFTTQIVQFQSGDSLYIFSDGYVSQFGGEKQEKFKIKRFQELLLKIQDKSMTDQKQILEQTLIDWQKKNEQVDDILVIGVKL